MIRIGIDPGKDGFISIYDDGIYVFKAMPTIGKEYDLQSLFRYLGEVREMDNDVHAILENVHAFQGGGATSNFSFGFGCGAIEMTLVGNNIPYTKVNPKSWQKIAWEGVTVQYKPTKSQTGKKVDAKATSLLAAKRLFPTIDLRATERSSTPHDGKVDSLLMCYCATKI